MIDKNLDIANAWRGYRSKVLSPDCSKIQQDECKIAFYAGFVSCFEVVSNLTSLTEDEACLALDKLREESFDCMERLIEKMEEIIAK